MPAPSSSKSRLLCLVSSAGRAPSRGHRSILELPLASGWSLVIQDTMGLLTLFFLPRTAA